MPKSNLPFDPSSMERGLQLLDEEFDEDTELDALLDELKQESPQARKIGRLPIYLVVDTSASMSIEDKIALVNQQIKAMTDELRKDTRLASSAYISIIAFNDHARQIIPLTPLRAFSPPSLQADGNTSLGEALTLTAERISQEAFTGTTKGQGPDIEPTIFVMTDGYPTDDYTAGAVKLKNAPQKPKIIAIAFGNDADTNVLKSITNDVYKMGTLKQGDFKKLFKWFTDIITTKAVVSTKPSQKQISGKQILQLPPPPDSIVPV
jgi:uncharacterized protein YegL